MTEAPTPLGRLWSSAIIGRALRPVPLLVCTCHLSPVTLFRLSAWGCPLPLETAILITVKTKMLVPRRAQRSQGRTLRDCSTLDRQVWARNLKRTSACQNITVGGSQLLRYTVQLVILWNRDSALRLLGTVTDRTMLLKDFTVDGFAISCLDPALRKAAHP